MTSPATPIPADTLTIPEWANGPDGSGNGGWSAGLLAQHVPYDRADPDAAVAVSLRVPPPLARPLRVTQGDDTTELFDDSGEQPVLVATGTATQLAFAVPDRVRAITLDAAHAARAGYPFRDEHPFPRCITCGTARAADVPSLHINCGPVSGVTVTDEAGAKVPVFADTWTPTAELADPGDPAVASVAACWCALDCPSSTPFADPHAEFPSVLAQMAVRLDRRARIGEQHVLAAWLQSVDGRKRRAVSVLMDADGTVLGRAAALWIEVRPR